MKADLISGMSIRPGVRLLRLLWLLRVLIGIRDSIRIGDGLDLGSPLAEVAVEKEKGDDSTKKNRKHRNGQNGIHFRTIRERQGSESKDEEDSPQSITMEKTLKL